MVLSNLWEWRELEDGSLETIRNNVRMTLTQVWDPMLNRQSYEYRYTTPNGHGGGIADSADVEEAKREAERMASWSMAQYNRPWYGCRQ